MARDDLAFLSAAELLRRSRPSRCRRWTWCRRIWPASSVLDGHLHAYITVLRDDALAAARQAEQALQRGGALPPLFGVPMAVKDQFWTKGILTTNGSRVYRDFVPSEDATIVTRLKEAGAILLGKLNLSELAMGGTQQPPYGIPGTRGIWSARQENPAAAREWRWRLICVRLRWVKTPAARGGAGILLQRCRVASQSLRHDPHVLVHRRRLTDDKNRPRLRPPRARAPCWLRPTRPLDQP